MRNFCVAITEMVLELVFLSVAEVQSIYITGSKGVLPSSARAQKEAKERAKRKSAEKAAYEAEVSVEANAMGAAHRMNDARKLVDIRKKAQVARKPFQPMAGNEAGPADARKRREYEKMMQAEVARSEAASVASKRAKQAKSSADSKHLMAKADAEQRQRACGLGSNAIVSCQ